ncbi:unnamed protein product [Mytilus coruscus]|uniref:Integrase catalytic domain-containing protein n=1 Tax=Mytilus coruscus TaxID=42192 RepID=A0A6J8ELK9_MYTCO|nr:unnamed protein product [Mytilus coruscus]
MLQRIYEGHQGIERCKNRARDVLFWPAMSKQIEDVVQMCGNCNRFQNSNAKEPMIKAEFPSRPWEKVATDVFDFKNRQYLLIADYYYPKLLEVSILIKLTSDTVIMNIKSIFARYGIPEILVSDNARYYTNSKFQEFAKSWEFKHITLSP